MSEMKNYIHTLRRHGWTYIHTMLLYMLTLLQQLVRERDTIQQELETANSNALSRAGEISIIRANHAKVVREYEKKSLELQKVHADEAARQRAEVEKARAERERIATEIEFLKRDLTEETERVRNLTRNAKAGEGKAPTSKTAAGADIVTTPKKGIVLPYRDGFDDDEIMVASPSKTANKPKAVTPKAGAKRKRKPTEDSPVQPLHLTQPKRDDEPRPTSPLRQPPSNAVEHVQPIPRTGDTRFEVLTRLAILG